MTAFFLVSPSEKGKILSIENGKLCHLPPGEGSSIWTKKIVPHGFHIMTLNKEHALHYDSSKDEEVKVVPTNFSNLTVWHSNENGEIYTQLPNNERKYMWTISDGVYVTPDEYLAENWKMVSLEGFDLTADVADNHKSKMPMWVWGLVIIIILVILLYL
jgi:hypothetical protein